MVDNVLGFWSEAIRSDGWLASSTGAGMPFNFHKRERW